MLLLSGTAPIYYTVGQPVQHHDWLACAANDSYDSHVCHLLFA
jgi:hypothetical protein